MSQLVPKFELPPILDAASAGPLVQELLALRGGPLTIDGGRVTRLGGLGLQAILSARATWTADGQSLEFTNLSPAMQETLTLCGVASLGSSTDV